jgi:hypothetical protein
MRATGSLRYCAGFSIERPWLLPRRLHAFTSFSVWEMLYFAKNAAVLRSWSFCDRSYATCSSALSTCSRSLIALAVAASSFSSSRPTLTRCSPSAVSAFLFFSLHAHLLPLHLLHLRLGGRYRAVVLPLHALLLPLHLLHLRLGGRYRAVLGVETLLKPSDLDEQLGIGRHCGLLTCFSLSRRLLFYDERGREGGKNQIVV